MDKDKRNNIGSAIKFNSILFIGLIVKEIVFFILAIIGYHVAAFLLRMIVGCDLDYYIREYQFIFFIVIPIMIIILVKNILLMRNNFKRASEGVNLTEELKKKEQAEKRAKLENYYGEFPEDMQKAELIYDNEKLQEQIKKLEKENKKLKSNLSDTKGKLSSARRSKWINRL